MLGLCLAHEAFTQDDDRRKGTLFLNDRSQLSGWVLYKPKAQGKEVVRLYADSITRKYTLYTVADVALIELKGQGRLHRSTELGHLAADSASGQQSAQQPTWLRCIIKSTGLSLFVQQHGQLTFYYLDSNALLTPLKMSTVMDGGYERPLPLFRNQLSMLLSQMGKLTEENAALVDHTAYQENDLIRVFDILNNSAAYYFVFPVIHRQPRLSLFVNGGISPTSMHLSGDVTHIGRLSFNPTIHPYVAVGAEFSRIGLGKTSLRVEVAYTQATFSGKGPMPTSPSTQSSYEFSQRRIIPAFSMQHPLYDRKALRIYGGLGACFNIATYKGNVWQQSFPALKLDNYARLKRNYIGLRLSAAVRLYQQFEVGVARQFIDEFISHSVRYRFEPSVLHFWLGYYL